MNSHFLICVSCLLLLFLLFFMHAGCSVWGLLCNLASLPTGRIGSLDRPNRLAGPAEWAHNRPNRLAVGFGRIGSRPFFDVSCFPLFFDIISMFLHGSPSEFQTFPTTLRSNVHEKCILCPTGRIGLQHRPHRLAWPRKPIQPMADRPNRLFRQELGGGAWAAATLHGSWAQVPSPKMQK